MVERKCGVQGWVFESGQFVVNKYGQGGMNLAALVAANEMNKDYNFWYDFSEGVSKLRLLWKVLHQVRSKAD